MLPPAATSKANMSTSLRAPEPEITP